MAGWFDGVSEAGRDVYADDRAGLSRGAPGRGREVRVSLRSARQVHSLREWPGAATGAAADEVAGEGINNPSKKAPGQFARGPVRQAKSECDLAARRRNQ